MGHLSDECLFSEYQAVGQRSFQSNGTFVRLLGLWSYELSEKWHGTPVGFRLAPTNRRDEMRFSVTPNLFYLHDVNSLLAS